MPSIIVNGREYQSLEEMPPDVRRQYERAIQMLADRDGNGLPDILENGAQIQSSDEMSTTIISTQIFNINGQEYDRWEDVPPHLQQMLHEMGASPQGALASKRRDVATLPYGRRQVLDQDVSAGQIRLRLSGTLLLALVLASLVTGLIVWWWF